MKEKEPRQTKTIRLKPEFIKWMNEQIEKGEFWNFSHVIEVALKKLRDSKT